MDNTHYVKFMRGSVTAWASLLQTPNKIDDDTLYFIYETIENPTEGSLYLGKKLISGDSSGNSIINIGDISNVLIDDLADKQILVYNETTQKWENTSLSTIINTAIGTFTGATAQTNGSSGLVPAPQAGDQNKYLRGDKTWHTINIPSFDPNVFSTVENNIITLTGIVSAPVGTIPMKTNAGIQWASLSVGNISREIITMEDLLLAIEDETAREDIIYMIPIDNPTDSSNQYEEYMIINGAIELIGTIGDVNLSDYVTTSVFNNTVGNLNSSISSVHSKVTLIETKIGDLNQLILSEGNLTLVDEINTMNMSISELSDRLQWAELTN